MRLTLALVCFCSSIASAQFTSMRWEVEGDHLNVTLGPPAAYGSTAIAGFPYSAEETSERVQTLADGTHITQSQSHRKLWRDSQGRTRIEQQIGLGMPMEAGMAGKYILVEVRDPVAGFIYVLDEQAKVAHRLAAPASDARRRVPPASTAASAAKLRTQFETEKLGSQNIEGIVAEGTRSTRTFPVGEIGNDRPIVTISEYWISQELKQMVLSKTSDPRLGDNTMRWTNITRTEPDASLFTVPSGYTIVDEKDSITVALKRQ